MRSPACCRSGLESRARSISEVSSASLNRLHQLVASADSDVILLSGWPSFGGCATHPLGVSGVDAAKLGPTVQPEMLISTMRDEPKNRRMKTSRQKPA